MSYFPWNKITTTTTTTTTNSKRSLLKKPWRRNYYSKCFAVSPRCTTKNIVHYLFQGYLTFTELPLPSHSPTPFPSHPELMQYWSKEGLSHAEAAWTDHHRSCPLTQSMPCRFFRRNVGNGPDKHKKSSKLQLNLNERDIKKAWKDRQCLFNTESERKRGERSRESSKLLWFLYSNK